MGITYKDTLINIIGFNNALLKLKCIGDTSETPHKNEVKFIRDIMKRSVEYALSSYTPTHNELQQERVK